MRKTIIIGLLGLLSLMGPWGEARGQAVARLSADTIALGDQTTLSIHNALNYPSTEMLTQNGIEALRQDFDTASRTQYTVLTSFEPGEHWLKLSPNDSLPLVVTDVEVDSATAELRDIAPLQRIPYTFWEIFRWVLLALGVAAAVFGVWWLLTHRKEVQQVLTKSEPVDTRTPAERALDTLEELRRRQLWQSGQVKEYHTELTDAVRRFIEESTGIRATDMTSDETMEAVTSLCPVAVGFLKGIFTTADLVKFAKSEPLPHEHEASLKAAVEFVNTLWQTVKPEEGEEKAAQEKEGAHE
ncbi:MAG: hypothetical protein IKP83_03860 [Bacteroidales bacterium]|nr:hypothetical protein [Bacteroidales bacterium]